jgi:hypothetical protein
MFEKYMEKMNISMKSKSLKELSSDEKLYLENYIEDNRDLLKELSKM